MYPKGEVGGSRWGGRVRSKAPGCERRRDAWLLGRDAQTATATHRTTADLAFFQNLNQPTTAH